MAAPASPLLRHLTLAVVLKLAVLAVLWWAFVRDAGVRVDSEAAAAHLGVPAPTAPAASSSTPGAHP
jgi:hypothetical protein